MLILRRRATESIVIDGGRIIIEIAEIAAGVVKLAITAPRETAIRRAESPAPAKSHNSALRTPHSALKNGARLDDERTPHND